MRGTKDNRDLQSLYREEEFHGERERERDKEVKTQKGRHKKGKTERNREVTNS